MMQLIIARADDRGLADKEVPEHDFVYHLASAVGVRLIIDQPVKTVETIVNTTAVFLRGRLMLDGGDQVGERNGRDVIDQAEGPR